MTDLSPETVGKLMALVREMGAYRGAMFEGGWTRRARELLPELPEPVDPDLVEAKRIIADTFGSPYFVGGKQLMHGEGPRRIHDIITGNGDKYWEVNAVRAAIKRGRALAAGDRS